MVFCLQNVFRHPDYIFRTKKHDIALIQVVGDLLWTENIRPACLHTDIHDLGPDINLTLSGWGTTDPKGKKMH